MLSGLGLRPLLEKDWRLERVSLWENVLLCAYAMWRKENCKMKNEKSLNFELWKVETLNKIRLQSYESTD